MSDEDVIWLSELPYTITIPSQVKMDSNNSDEIIESIVVHAGLVPGVDLHDQTIETMVTIREVDEILEKDENSLSDHAIDEGSPHYVTYSHSHKKRGRQEGCPPASLSLGRRYGKGRTESFLGMTQNEASSGTRATGPSG